MIIAHVLGDCPWCRRERTYGVCLIRGNSALIGCSACNKRYEHKLPKLRKKILYLDQCFHSSLYRSDEEVPPDIVRLLRKLGAYQQLVAPFSPIHETESYQMPGGRDAELFEFIKSTARGHGFESEDEIQLTQLYRAFKAFLSSDPVGTQIKRADALSDRIDYWDEYVWINMKVRFQDPERISQAKEEYSRRLVSLFPQWRNESLSFADIQNEEVGGLRKNLLSAYQRAVSTLDVLSMGFTPIRSLLDNLGSSVSIEEGLKAVDDFLSSEHFARAPYVEISANLHSVLRKKIQEGQYTNEDKAMAKLAGLYFDIQFISVYAPYCDAMFVDNTMYQWCNDGDVALQERWGVRLFSRTNLESFGDYLAELDKNTPSDVIDAVQLLYC